MSNAFCYNEQEYKNILIYGYSTSGKSVEKVLKKINANYAIYDDNIKVFDSKCIRKLNKSTLLKFDLIIISPAVSIYNKKIVLAEKLNIKVISEIEFAYTFCKVPIIAVTGTNGKTTTVGVLAHLLKAYGKNVMAMGNIGLPFSEIIEYENLDYVVLEVSSFQLEATDLFKPDIGVILNIDEDHIDRHKTFKNYVECKLNLLKRCTNNDYAVLNADDRVLVQSLDYINGNKIFVSDKKPTDYFVKNKHLVKLAKRKTELVQEVLLDNEDMEMCKTFSVNILAVCAVLDILNIKLTNFKDHIKDFNWFSCRLEFVKTVKGVDFVNDSKATNIHATKFAISKTDNDIVLLLGGQDKDLNFDEFFENISEKVVTVICFGNAGKKIYKSALKNNFDLAFCVKTLKDAILLGYDTARIGETVLLSPACASFDEFKSYKHRGEFFAKVVNTLD